MAEPSDSDLPVTEASVLIVGSSMCGMTLSALLAKQGVRGSITVERHSSTAIHPRAALFHPRTMQIYHELGLYDEMRTESLNHYDEFAGLYNVESLAGKHLNTYMDDLNEGLESISPFPRLFLTQQMFEPLLRECAMSHGADLRFSTEMVDFHQDDDGVTAVVIDHLSGKKEKIRAKYMIAADGSRSKVRERLGIPLKSHGLLSESITIYFEADLGKFIRGKYNGVIYVVNENVRGFFRLNKAGDEGFLVVSTYGPRSEDQSRFPSVGITQEKAAEILRAAIGADVPFKITHLSPWTARCDVAQNFNVGRVLIAGDAAHINTPHGGFGGNTGIQDAHNLAWKLAYVLQGIAGRDLVEKTYEAERQPVCEKTVNQVFAKYLARTDPELPQSTRWQTDSGRNWLQKEEKEVPETWLELGYRYHSRAVLTTSLSNVLEDPETVQARPGSLARHVLITTEERSEAAFPLAEVLGQMFVLVVGEDAVGWKAAMQSDELKEYSAILKQQVLACNPAHRNSTTVDKLAELDINATSASNSIKTRPIETSKRNVAFYDKYAISSDGCVLIRPDSCCAWSSAGPPSPDGPSGPQVLHKVLRQLLCNE